MLLTLTEEQCWFDQLLHGATWNVPGLMCMRTCSLGENHVWQQNWITGTECYDTSTGSAVVTLLPPPNDHAELTNMSQVRLPLWVPLNWSTYEFDLKVSQYICNDKYSGCFQKNDTVAVCTKHTSLLQLHYDIHTTCKFFHLNCHKSSRCIYPWTITCILWIWF